MCLSDQYKFATKLDHMIASDYLRCDKIPKKPVNLMLLFDEWVNMGNFQLDSRIILNHSKRIIHMKFQMFLKSVTSNKRSFDHFNQLSLVISIQNWHIETLSVNLNEFCIYLKECAISYETFTKYAVTTEFFGISSYVRRVSNVDYIIRKYGMSC